MVARELEREFKDLKKFEKHNQRVWEKGISTRIDRAGTIRVVNGIPALRVSENERRKGGVRDASGALLDAEVSPR